MKVSKLIELLQQRNPDADVEIRIEFDECNTCEKLGHLQRDKCSLSGAIEFTDFDTNYTNDIFVIQPY